MNRLWVVLNIVLLVTFFGTTICEEGACLGYSGEYRDGSRVFDVVFKPGKICVELGATPASSIQLQQAKTIEDYREFFRGYCQRQSIVRECLQRAAKHFETCQNDTYTNAFGIGRGLLETLLDLECTGESARLPTFWRKLIILASNPTEIEKLSPCFLKSVAIIDDVGNSDVDMASKVYMFYKEIQFYKGCLHQVEMDQEFKDLAEFFLTEIVNKMKCLNPQDGTFETCATIDTSLISKTSACSVKTPADELSRYDSLEDEVGTCFDYMLEYDQPDMAEIVDRDAFENTPICYYKNIHKCLGHMSTYSERCMNVAQQKEFSIFVGSIQDSFSAGCVEDNDRLIDVLLEVYRQKRTGHGNIISDCIELVKSTRLQNNTVGGSPKNMRFYHEMEAFKGCLVSKLQGHQASVDAATSLIDEVLGIVKCVHPEDGSAVLCKSILAAKSHSLLPGQP